MPVGSCSVRPSHSTAGAWGRDPAFGAGYARLSPAGAVRSRSLRAWPPLGLAVGKLSARPGRALGPAPPGRPRLWAHGLNVCPELPAQSWAASVDAHFFK